MNFSFDNLPKEGLHEECGVFGIYSDGTINPAYACYNGLLALQHRGQESCGIAVSDDGVMNYHKDMGLVSEVFNNSILDSLSGQAEVSHVRYSTAGGSVLENAQPLVMRYIKGTLAVAHNGNLTNAVEIRKELEKRGAIFQTTIDSEVICYMIARERINSGSAEKAVVEAVKNLEGAYSLLVMSPTKLIAARDPHGFRPLCIGQIGEDIVFASESCALDSVGARFVRDVEPGEIVIVDRDGLRIDRRHVGKAPKTTCIFEYLYFARPDSVIDGSSVHRARVRAGELLAQEHPVEADVVIGVPDSGIDAAIGYARASGIPYGIGFIKNKYIGRTFIQPTQSDREDKVRIKLNPVAEVVRGKRVVMVDDSIVRGTTSARIVRLLRNAGATEVHFRSSAPKFLNPCYFGTDIDSRENLIACKYSTEDIATIIGVDTLGFLSCESVLKIPERSRGFCDACFTGNYPVEPPRNPGTSKFEYKISERKGEKSE